MSQISMLLIAAFCFAGTEVSAQESRPNIIFLMTDDQCTNSLGCYGNRDVKTVNIDALAADGMVFENHYDTTAICMASRANVLTGMFEYKTGCNFSHGPLVRSKWQKSYPMLLREAGYLTAFAGKFGLEVADQPANVRRTSSPSPRSLPVDDFDWWGAGPGQTHYETKKNKSMARYADEYPHSSRAYGAFGRDFIVEATKQGKPFCLSISFKAPHRPVTPDPVDDDVYASTIFSMPENFGRDHGEHFSLQSRTGRQYERFYSWNYYDKYNEVMRQYHQQIYAVDAAVGMIREGLKASGVNDNTVIIFTSDNGFFCGAHGYGSKVLPYEEASRVPLIVFDPRHSSSGKGLRCNALTGNVDFAPTILDLAGLPIPQDMDGRSLRSLLDDPSNSIHESLPLINVWGPATAHSLAVVTQDWKYVYWPHENENMQATEELFQTSTDPLELKQLAESASHREDLNHMRNLYDRTLANWKAEAVSFHGYSQFGTIFDRTVEWKDKKELVRNY